MVRKKQKMFYDGNSKLPVVFAAIGLAFIYFVFFHGDYGLIQYWRLLSQRDELKQELIELKQEQDELQEEIELLKNNFYYIEKVARERYKMGRKKEKVYIIIDNQQKK